MTEIKSPQALTPLLGPLCFTGCTARASTDLTEVVICIGCSHAESKVLSLCPVNAGQWQHMLATRIAPHSSLSERPAMCRCRHNVLWPVNIPVTSLNCFLWIPRQLITRPSNQEPWGPHSFTATGCSECLVFSHSWWIGCSRPWRGLRGALASAPERFWPLLRGPSNWIRRCR